MGNSPELKPEKTDPQSTADAGIKNSGEHNGGDSHSTTAVDQIPPIRRRPHTRRRRQWINLAGILGLLVNIVVAGYLIKQTNLMSEQVKAMRETSNDTIVAQKEIANQGLKAAQENFRQSLDSGDRSLQKTLDKMNEQTAAATRLAQEAKRQTDLAVLGRRPWLGIEGDVKITRSVPGRVDIEFKLRNFGQSPAIFANPTFRFIPEGGIARKSLLESEKNCEPGERNLQDSGPRRVADPSRVAAVIFPGPDATFSQEAYSIGLPNDSPSARGSVIGCIAYRDLEGISYHTQVMYAAEGRPQVWEDGEKKFYFRRFERLQLLYAVAE